MKNLASLLILTFTLTQAQAQRPCAQSVDTRTFSNHLQQIRVMSNDASRIGRSLQLLEVYCLNSMQLFDLASAFIDDSYRFDIIAAGYPGMTDQQNAFALLDVFQRFSTAFRAYDYINFVDRGRNRPAYWTRFPREPVVPVQPVQPVEPPQPVCAVSEQEMNDVRSSIKAQTFDGSMQEQAKMLLRTKACFTTGQIISIIRLFSFDGSQVEIAKFAYDYCVDQQNYFKVVDIFTFDSSKRAVRDHINARQ
jgi:hypothetical protein